MRLLAVPSWSFGRDKRLLSQFREALESRPLALHYCASDIDHNRTVTAFSGEPDALHEAVIALASLCFDCIDLNRHVGVYPRIGGLDVCPIILLPSTDCEKGLEEAQTLVDQISHDLADRFDLPVYLYEKSERNRQESEWPELRKGGFGSLSGKSLKPDYGPLVVHPQLGVSTVGVQSFFLSVNVDLQHNSPLLAKSLAGQARELRMAGDPRFLGVRAMGFALASREQSQVSFTLTLPDVTSVDPLIEWVAFEASRSSVVVAGTELVGVIRKQDLAGAERLKIQQSQVVE